LHGAINTIGFLSAWGIAEFPQLAGPTLLASSAEPGDPAMIVLGLLWLAAAVVLLIAARSAERASLRWVATVAVGAAVSLVPTVIWWSDAIFGVVLNIVILVGVLAWHISAAATRHHGPEGLE
jgi:hypothetical protein